MTFAQAARPLSMVGQEELEHWRSTNVINCPLHRCRGLGCGAAEKPLMFMAGAERDPARKLAADNESSKNVA
jgi:hypothetical protein